MTKRFLAVTFAVITLAFTATATANPALNGAWVYRDDVFIFDNGNWETWHEGNRDMAGTYTTDGGGTANGGTLTLVTTAIHGGTNRWRDWYLNDSFGIDLDLSRDWYTKSDIRATVIAATLAGRGRLARWEWELDDPGEGRPATWEPGVLEAKIDEKLDDIFINFTATYSVVGNTLTMTTADWEMWFTRR